MDVDKICLTCLSSTGPLLSIYDGGSGSCLADMIREFTKTKPRRNDNLPEKVCLSCLSEISNCYTFKIKCENSSRTLRQLLPNALPEEPDNKVSISCPVATADQAVQTTSWEPVRCTASVQTDAVATTDAEQNTSLVKSTISVDLDYEGEGEVFDYELPDEPVEKTTSLILQVQGNLKDEKEVVFTQTNVIYESDDHELEQQIRECNLAIFEGVDNEAEIITVTAPQVTTRKSAAKLLTQQENEKLDTPVTSSKEEAGEIEKEQVPQTAKRSSRRRGGVKQDVPTTPPSEAEPSSKQHRLGTQRKLCAPKTGTVNSTSTMSGGAAITPELKYHCDRCNAGFALEKSLMIHRRQKGCINRNFKCNECEKVFVSPDHLAEHQASHGAHNCPECGIRCDSKEQLSKHMVQGHKRNLRNQCNICQKVFTMLSTLRDHMRIHTGEKPFVCNICGKSFTQNANLRQHKLRHSETKSFKCELCPHSFVTKAELTSHARTHTGDKPFECEVCLARFTTSCSLAKHKRKHTGERPYACDLCPMRFTALNVLKNHRRTHTGERPYVCPFCSKTFTQRGDCQMHQRTHQGDRIYICPVCNEEFKSMHEMRSHLAGHEQHDKRLVHFTFLSNKENGSGALEEDLNEMTESALML
ncbi:zinc finger protein 2 isoform X1 [Drosophila santomea]|uniref:zinc finger protein 2 isoform X1 n=1 Tax=Drosophila santomea TaxID=129105 RepID=UPI0019544D7D|nr:zinc finger protein 2 isoform X1 [Drosophila santomea]